MFYGAALWLSGVDFEMDNFEGVLSQRMLILFEALCLELALNEAAVLQFELYKLPESIRQFQIFEEQPKATLGRRSHRNS